MKKYIYLLMMNYDPMGGECDWQPIAAYLDGLEAQDALDKMWDEEWGSQDEDTYSPPIDKDEWLRLDKVELR